MRSPVPAAVLALLFGGCKCNVECSAGDTKVDQTKANALVKSLADQVDNATSVECPGDVEAKAGTTFDCTVTFAGGGRQTAVVTVTAVDADSKDVQANASWRTPLFGAKQRALLETSIAQKMGVKVAIVCKDGVVPLAVDQRLRCAVRGAAGEVPVDIWLDADGDLGWKINPDAPDAPAGAAPTAEAPPQAPATP